MSHKSSDRQTYLLPSARGVGLAGSVDSVLKLAEIDKGGCKAVRLEMLEYKILAALNI